MAFNFTTLGYVPQILGWDGSKYIAVCAVTLSGTSCEFRVYTSTDYGDSWTLYDTISYTTEGTYSQYVNGFRFNADATKFSFATTTSSTSFTIRSYDVASKVVSVNATYTGVDITLQNIAYGITSNGHAHLAHTVYEKVMGTDYFRVKYTYYNGSTWAALIDIGGSVGAQSSAYIGTGAVCSNDRFRIGFYNQSSTSYFLLARSNTGASVSSTLVANSAATSPNHSISRPRMEFLTLNGTTYIVLSGGNGSATSGEIWSAPLADTPTWTRRQVVNARVDHVSVATYGTDKVYAYVDPYTGNSNFYTATSLTTAFTALSPASSYTTGFATLEADDAGIGYIVLTSGDDYFDRFIFSAPAVTLSGTANGASVVTGALKGIDLLSGTVNGASVVNGTLETVIRLTGTANGAGTSAGIASVIKRLSGTSNGTSVITGALKGIDLLSGTANGASVVSGTLKQIRRLTGTSNGASVSTGTLKQIRRLTGTSNGASVSTGVANVIKRLSGAPDGTSVITGVLSSTKRLTGTSNGASVSTGSLAVIKRISGNSVGASVTSGTLRQARLLSGSSVGASVITGTLRQARLLSGTSVGASVSTGGLTVTSSPSITQSAFRFYDDGTESGAIALAAQNANYTAVLSGEEETIVRIAHSFATVTVVNTVVETDLVSLQIPANDGVAGDVYKFYFTGDANQNGLACTYKFRLKLGTTLLLETVPAQIGSSSTRRPWVAEGSIFVVSTSSQRVGATLHVGNEQPSGNWGNHILPNSADYSRYGYGSASEDLTVAKNLILTIEMGTADVSADVRFHAGTLEKHKV